jgi:phosphatidylglycerophosphate synthase
VSKLPPFSSVLKSRDVEDPVNLWVHRPLAYAFVWLVYRTPLTPNQVTFLACLVGIAAGTCWLVGSPSLMVLGGILLWASAILDGADGILARAKNLQTDLGRALDGVADLVVAFVTVVPAAYRIWLHHHQPIDIVVMAIALATAILHIEVYDFYCRSYLTSTDPNWDGKPERISEVTKRRDDLKKRGAGFIQVFASSRYVDLIVNQTRFVNLTNPAGRREDLRFPVTPETASLYRKYNRGLMRLWPWISLAPHSYLMAICGMFDQLYLYLLFRAFVANAIFIAVLLWQRSASTRWRRALEQIGAAPVPAE